MLGLQLLHAPWLHPPVAHDWQLSPPEPHAAAQNVVESQATQVLPGPIPGEDQPGLVMTQSGAPDQDSVLVNLVTYREQ